MKAYIAGKITGDPKYRERFQVAQEALERAGYTVLNPAVLPQGMEPSDYMRIYIAMMDSADVVFLLPDWFTSREAGLEWEWCTFTQKSTLLLEKLPEYQALTEQPVEVTLRMSVYDEEEIHHNCTVQVLRNSVTGEQSIGWWQEDRPPAALEGGEN